MANRGRQLSAKRLNAPGGKVGLQATSAGKLSFAQRATFRARRVPSPMRRGPTRVEIGPPAASRRGTSRKRSGKGAGSERMPAGTVGAHVVHRTRPRLDGWKFDGIGLRFDAQFCSDFRDLHIESL